MVWGGLTYLMGSEFGANMGKGEREEMGELGGTRVCFSRTPVSSLLGLAVILARISVASSSVVVSSF